ncbi:MAG: glycosyltransferase family 4 protein [Thermoanaerobaculia bacterium]
MPLEPVTILHTTAHLGTGGIARIVLRTAAGLAPERFRSLVCHLTPHNDFEEECRRLGLAPVCAGHRRPWHGPRTVARLVRLLRRHRVELVHTHHPLDRLYAGLAARIAGVPVVITLHNTTPPSRPARGLRRRLGLASTGSLGDRWTVRTAARFVAVSEAVLRAQAAYLGVPPERTVVVHPGVDSEEIARPVPEPELRALRTALDLGTGPVLLHVGRLHEQKGQEHLVTAMPRILGRHPDAALLIAGEGEERPRLETLIHRLGLERSVRLLGHRSDVSALLALADLFVFPSVHKEGLPVAVVEASAAGLPVVAARTAPLEEAVEDGVTGLLVPPRDSGALAAAACRLLGDPDRRSAMGRAGRRRAAERFSLAASVERLEGLYREVLAERGGHG